MKEKKEKKAKTAVAPVAHLDIPEDEIWTYRIEGLQEPHIGGSQSHSFLKKVLTVAALLVAIGLSIFLSVRALHKETFEYKPLDDGTYELVKFSNPGDQTELTVDFADGDATKPVTVLHEYFLNCDEMLRKVTIGKDVRTIDGKAFYSCWNLNEIRVDPENPYFCDVDGVLYTKDLTKVICYPIDHDQYLREQNGYKDALTAEDEGFDAYAQAVLTYRLPPQTKTIGMLAFNYAEIASVCLPEGLETIETMAFFKSAMLSSITTFGASGEYPSLPEGLVYIGSDAFSYDQGLTYLFIPDSVNYIGHHAFWDTVYVQKDEQTGKKTLGGIAEIHVSADKETFESQVQAGDQWKPKYDYMLFKKTVVVQYGAERASE